MHIYYIMIFGSVELIYCWLDFSCMLKLSGSNTVVIVVPFIYTTALITRHSTQLTGLGKADLCPEESFPVSKIKGIPPVLPHCRLEEPVEEDLFLQKYDEFGNSQAFEAPVENLEIVCVTSKGESLDAHKSSVVDSSTSQQTPAISEGMENLPI